jgi:hypothetical protein
LNDFFSGLKNVIWKVLNFFGLNQSACISLTRDKGENSIDVDVAPPEINEALSSATAEPYQHFKQQNHIQKMEQLQRV